ncbi:hypothetical protein BO78DRAFT_123359 [Aspergillus sclerotiicarbonarius CBS 121057]|uniref:Uncharacterized protein n=1 Tax=Aspergillus sclerotiicarbonarius (strain CBS 121057 / IBT 28362) TaxID=1448318 RepID=A0A319EDZ9_ASPSB|nr:hypothetical protein BO78DRAFT_123359 [Aspergillus sclerotiicarbonarius CBS 121057]
MCRNTRATSGSVICLDAQLSGLVLDSQDDARGDGLEDRFGFGIHCFMSTFASCYVLLPTLYLVPADFLFPVVAWYSYFYFIFDTLLPLLHILVRSPTLDHHFFLDVFPYSAVSVC